MTPRPAARLHRLTAALPPDPDRHLLAAFLDDRNEPAFAELVRRHGPLVYGVCRRVLGHAQDAEDAFQATFLVLARKAGAVTRAESLSPWLYAVAVRTARELRHMRDRRRIHERLTLSGGRQPSEVMGPRGADDPRSGEPDPDLVALLDEELAKLPDHYRRPVVLCELQGRPRKAVAAELGIPEGTLSSRLAAAKKKLAARLARRGVTATAALASVLAGEASARAPSALMAHAARAAGGLAAASPVAAHLADGVVKALFVTKLKSLAVVAGLAIVGLGGVAWVPGPGGSSPAAHAADSPAKPAPTADAFVRQLGSPKFADREAAEKALRSLGTKAKPAVRAGTKDPDPEIAKRAAAVLDAIRKEQSWPRFKELLGDDADARALFDAIRSVPRNIEMIEAAEEKTEDVSKLYADRRAELNERCTDRSDPKRTIWWPTRVSAEEMAGFLYLGTFPGAADGKYAHGGAENHFVMFFRDMWQNTAYPFSAALTKGPLKAGCGRLLVKWTETRTHPSELERGLNGAIAFGLADIVPFAKAYARKVTADKPKYLPEPLLLALSAVAKLGTKDDLPLLMGFADDRTVVRRTFMTHPEDEKNPPREFRPGKDYSLELRDAAVVAALVLCGQSRQQIDEYGFFASRYDPRLIGNPLPPVGKRRYADDPLTPGDLGFVRDVDREAAHTKARAWLAGQIKSEIKSDAAPTHPAWPRFKELAGDGDDARKLFTELVADPHRAKVLAGLTADPTTAPAAYRAEAARMVADRERQKKRPTAGIRTAGDQPPPDPIIPRADHILFLFLGSYPGTGAVDRDIPTGTLKGITGELFVQHYPLFGRKPGHAIAGLYSHWLDRRSDTAVLREGFKVVGHFLERDFPGVLRTARRVLADRDHPAATRAAAALVIGRYGTAADLPALAALADEEAEVASTVQKDVHYTTTAADVAVGVSAWITGGDLAGLGFPYVAQFNGRQEKRADEQRVLKFLSDSRSGLSLQILGFPDVKSRTAAHAKAKAWLAAQK